VIRATQHARLIEIAESARREGSPVAEYLMEELIRAHIVPDDACPTHVVQMGSHVTYVDDVGGRTHRVSVVYPTEANIDEQRSRSSLQLGRRSLG
jgi:regulator of nucleoside diphosphate kinase